MVERKSLKFIPDSKRVVARYFYNGEERTTNLIRRILSFTDEQVNIELENTLTNFKGRHRDLPGIFTSHFTNLESLVSRIGLEDTGFTEERKMLIGAYSTMEYAIE